MHAALDQQQGVDQITWRLRPSPPRTDSSRAFSRQADVGGETRLGPLESFPDDVRQFLQANISSVEQLEILRVLGEDPARQWNSEEVRKAAQGSAESINTLLQELHQRGLLRAWSAENVVYCQHGPHSPELELKVTRLLEMYQQRPVTMIRMVYEKPAVSLLNFADAFRLRKKD